MNRVQVYAAITRASAELEQYKDDPLAQEAAAGIQFHLEELLHQAERACDQARARRALEEGSAISQVDLDIAERAGLVRFVGTVGKDGSREYALTAAGKTLVGR